MIRDKMGILRRRPRLRPQVASLEGRLLLSADVTTYRNDNSRLGADLQETILNPTNVNATSFGQVSYLAMDGKVDAEPLYVSNVAIPGQGTHNVLIVATENDSVYAYDADNAQLLWHDGPSGTPNNLLPAGEAPVQATDTLGGNPFRAKQGILATPVIDPVTKTVYVVAESRTLSNGALTFFQRIHALDLTTGVDRVPPKSIDSSITYPGKGPGGDGTNVIFDPGRYKERTALTLFNGVVYTGWASIEDTPPYTGWTIGFRTSDLGVAAILNINPNGTPSSTASSGTSGNTFWNAGGGFAVDSSGFLYNVSGNGPFDASAGDFGDSFLKFSTANGLSIADYYTPSNQQELADLDADLGSTGVMLLPDVADASGRIYHLALSAGKDGSIYVVDRDNMGRFDATTNRTHQQVVGALGAAVADGMAFFNGTLYVGANNQPLRAFTMTNSYLSTAPTSQTSTIFGYPGTAPSLSANGNLGGIVWAVENNTLQAVLHAYDASNLSHELYNSNQAAGGRDNFGSNSKFITPMIANGKVYVGTDSGLVVFGLLPDLSAGSGPVTTTAPVPPPPPPPPPPPSFVVPAFSSAYPTVGGFNLLGAIGDDVNGEASLTYTWTALVAPFGVAPPTFSQNGNNGSKLVGVALVAPGAYFFEVRIASPSGQVATSNVTLYVDLAAPVFSTPAFSSLRPVVGKPGLLGAAGYDPVLGESSLSYTWTTLSKPVGAPLPIFSSNGTNASKLVAVTFQKPGIYRFRVTVVNPAGAISWSEVSVGVGARTTAIVVPVPRPVQKRGTKK